MGAWLLAHLLEIIGLLITLFGGGYVFIKTFIGFDVRIKALEGRMEDIELDVKENWKEIRDDLKEIRADIKEILKNKADKA